MTLQLTIIGLGQIGTSIGLALANHQVEFTRIGHDRAPDTARKAEKMGAVDKIVFNVHRAVEKADIVLLASPLDEIQEILEQIAPDLKEEAVVMDTSSCMVAVSEFAKKLLPANRFFVTIAPSLNPDFLFETSYGTSSARADLFQKSLMVITSPPGTDPDALKLAVYLIELLGASPFFADPWEFDGLMAAVRLLPCLNAAALVNATTTQPGWQEARKFAGRPYAWGTQPVYDFDESNSLGHTALLNRENVLRVLDNYSLALEELREAIATQNAEKLAGLLRQAQDNRSGWLGQRLSNDYGSIIKPPEVPRPGNSIGRLFGLGPQKKGGK